MKDLFSAFGGLAMLVLSYIISIVFEDVDERISWAIILLGSLLGLMIIYYEPEVMNDYPYFFMDVD